MSESIRFEDYMGFAASLAIRYGKSVHPSWREDLKQTAFMGLWEAVLGYDPSRGPFEPYAHRVIRNDIRNFLRWLRGRWEPEQYSIEQVLLPNDEKDEEGVTGEDLLVHKETDWTTVIPLQDALAGSRELRLYAEGYSMNEIGRMLGCHRLAVFRRIDKAREQLRQALTA